MPDNYIRVRLKGQPGHHLTIRESKFNEDAYVRLEEDPLNENGDPKPMTPKTTVTKAAGQKATTSGQQADTRKDKD